MALSINTVDSVVQSSSQLDFSLLQESQEPRPWNGNVRMTWTIHMARNWRDKLMNHSVLAEDATDIPLSLINKSIKCREVNVGCLVSRWIQPLKNKNVYRNLQPGLEGKPEVVRRMNLYLNDPFFLSFEATRNSLMFWDCFGESTAGCSWDFQIICFFFHPYGLASHAFLTWLVNHSEDFSWPLIIVSGNPDYLPGQTCECKQIKGPEFWMTSKHIANLQWLKLSTAMWPSAFEPAKQKRFRAPRVGFS